MRTGWPVTLALAAGGSLAGHWLAYRVVTPDADARAHELAESGHGYLSLAPPLLTSLYALALLALCLRTVAAWRGRDETPLPAWGHAAIPPLAFVLQEHAERAVHDGAFPAGAVLEPTFAVGFAIQIPFALAAICAARLRAARRRSRRRRPGRRPHLARSRLPLRGADRRRGPPPAPAPGRRRRRRPRASLAALTVVRPRRAPRSRAERSIDPNHPSPHGCARHHRRRVRGGADGSAAGRCAR